MHFVALGPVFRGKYYHFFARPPPLELLVCVCGGPHFFTHYFVACGHINYYKGTQWPAAGAFFFSATALLPSPASFALSDLQHDFIRGFYFPLL